MPSKTRLKRIADRMQQDLSEMLVRGVIHDPRLEGIYITDINIDRELAFANVFVSALEGKTREEEVIAGLNHAKGFLRKQLASKIQLRTFPELRFFWDPTPERAERIEKLIDTIQAEREKKEPKNEQAPID
ncbi:MAG: 30S ribosome-binding factor RbfA [Anaerolineaceae bacterium]|jgi:ribosome-binding factor A|nr:MAG: 30S ribosome-binding factor RbfA [Anaerolineaceae bacterium]